MTDLPRTTPPAAGDVPDEFDRLLGELRPKLHRYCARMTGSVVDGEDVVQEAFVKAIEALPTVGPVARPEAWLFRIAHNASLDFLRRRSRQAAIRSDMDVDALADPHGAAGERQAAAAGLRAFMHLPVAQRSSVILMDVFGYSLKEIGAVTERTVPAVKATLHRGRARLRALIHEAEDRPAAVLSEADRALLAAYVDRFNARDFDAIRDMLAEEVRLELVNKTRMSGKQEVSEYFNNYRTVRDWRFEPGLVEGRPAAVVYRPDDAARAPTYFVLLEWRGDRVMRIRDFRHARYAAADADVSLLT